MLVLLLPHTVWGQGDSQRALQRRVTVEGRSYPFAVLVPPGHQRKKPAPVVLVLHGSASRGTDGLRQVTSGMGGGIARAAHRFPGILVFPQLPADMTWQGRGTTVAIAALDSAIAEFGGDVTRTYLMGISMGGNGAWAAAWQQPQRFAALVVLCGWVSVRRGGEGSDYDAIAPGNPYVAVATRLARTPVWLFHGDADETVPAAESRQLHAAFLRTQAPVRYTELRGEDHLIADAVLARQDWTTWLFRQRRSP